MLCRRTSHFILPSSIQSSLRATALALAQTPSSSPQLSFHFHSNLSPVLSSSHSSSVFNHIIRRNMSLSSSSVSSTSSINTSPLPATSPLSKAQPLSGVRVIDMSRLLPGPLCTQMLRDLGAEVIKVEDASGGDYLRYYPPLLKDGNSALFHALNRGKKSVILDLRMSEHRDKFWDLLSTADVLVESFRPGVLTKFGFGVGAIHEKLPRLIICSISGYGQTGTDALRAGHDLNYMAKSGTLGIMEQPHVLPVQVADICGGTYPATIQILAALHSRDRTGHGEYIDVSMCDNSYKLMTMSLAHYNTNGDTFSKGKDLLSGGSICYGVYPTSNGHLSVGALEPQYWKALCQALKCPELIPLQFAAHDSEDFKKGKAKLTQIISAQSNEYWREFFAHKDLMCEVVELPEGVSQRNQHLKDRNVDITIKVPAVQHNPPTKTSEKVKVTESTQPAEEYDLLTVPRTALCMTGLVEVNQAGPLLGQHTKEIFAEVEELKKKKQSSSNITSRL